MDNNGDTCRQGAGLADTTIGARRDPKIDALRAVGMYAVVLNHAILATAMSLSEAPNSNFWNLVSIGVSSGAWVPESVYTGVVLNVAVSFHIALIAFLGGYVTRVSSARSPRFLLKRLHRLMVPYASWLLVAGLLSLGLAVSAVGAFWLRGMVNPHSTGSLWFLYVFFLCQVGFWAILRLPFGERLLPWSAVAAIFLSAFPSAPLVRYGASVLWLYPFLVAGFVFARSEVAQGLVRSAWSVVGGLAIYVATLLITWPQILPSENGLYAGAAGVIGMIVFAVARFLNALAAIALVWRAIDWLGHRGLAPLSWVGQRTIGIYASHSLFLGPLSLAGIGVLGTSLLSFFGSLGVTALLERIPVVRFLMLGERR